MSRGFSIEFELNEIGYRELMELAEQQVKMGAAHDLGDVLKLIYTAGFYQVKAATNQAAEQQRSGLIIPH